MINSLRVEEIQLQRLVLQKLAKILEGTIDETVIRKSLSKILPLNTWALNEYVNIILAEIIIIAPDLSEEILNQVKQLKIYLLIVSSLHKMVKAMPTSEAFNFLKKIALNPNIDYHTKIAVSRSIAIIINTISVSEAFIFLKNYL